MGRELQSVMHDLNSNETQLTETKSNFTTKAQEKEDTRTKSN
ncbi:MAG: hypothetical protein ACTSSK_02045 [Candidatus Heimdallarchaeota archaeon]